MSDNNQETRKPEEIESDIEEHRERLDRTLHELEERVSPRRLVDTTLDYVRSGGANEFTSNLSETIKRNPVPFMLTSVGLGWLILSQRNANNRSYHDDSDIYGYEDGKHYPMTTRTAPTSVPGEESTRVPPTTSVPSSTSVPPTTGTAATTTRVPPAAHATTPVGEGDHDDHRSNQGKGRMSGAKEKAQHMSGSAKERAQDMSSSAKGRAQGMSSSMRDGTARMKSGSRNAMRGASDRAQNAGQQTTYFIQEHPLVTAALGIAIGAAIGSLLPSTRTEDERLGGLRDRAVNRAAEEGEHYADQARARVHEKAEQKEKEAPSSSGSTSSTGGSTGTSSGSTGTSSSSSTSGTPGTGSSTGSSSTSGSTGTGSSTGAAGAPGTSRSPGISDSPSTGNTTTPGSAPSRPSDRGTSESDLTSGNKPPRGEGL